MALSIILRRSASRAIGCGNRVYGNLILPCASVPSLRQFSSSPSLSSQDNESLVKEGKRRSFDESLVNDLMSQVQSRQRELESLRKSYGKPLSAENESLVKGEGNDESESVRKGIDADYESSNDEGEGEDPGNYKSSDDSKQKSCSESDNDESLSKTSDNNEYSDQEIIPERDDKPDDDESLPKSKENERLFKGIQQEIMHAKEFMQLSAKDAIVPDDFPFMIENDCYEKGSIVLSQEYQGELIEVQVENPTLFMYKESRNDYNEKKSCSFSMDLTVVVSCMTSKLMKVELKCGARPEGISIYSAKDSAAGSDDEGVHMSEFNENLKGELVKYLEARGITVSTTKFLYGYMLDKANRDKLRILENIQKMVV